jgi:preprotein translocase subunit SecY
VPVAGLSYWLSPPTWRTLLTDQFRSFVYITYVLLTCATLSRLAIGDEECEENPDNVTADLLGPTQVTFASITIPNPDAALKKEIQRLIPAASVLGGLVLGCIFVASDVFGVIGGGQGMLVTTSILYKGYEMWLKERKAFTGRS